MKTLYIWIEEVSGTYVKDNFMPLQFFIFQQIFNSTCQDPTFLFSRHSFEFLSIFLTKSNVQLLALGKEAELNIAFWAQKPFAEIRHLQTRNVSLLYNIFMKNVGILQGNVEIYFENVLLSQYIDFKSKFSYLAKNLAENWMLRSKEFF